MKTWLFDKADIIKDNLSVPIDAEWLAVMQDGCHSYWQPWATEPDDSQIDAFLSLAGA